MRPIRAATVSEPAATALRAFSVWTGLRHAIRGPADSVMHPLKPALVAAMRRRHYTIDVIELTVEDGAVLVPIKVVPGASRTRIMGEWDGRLRVAVAAPPEKGKANKAIITLFATTLSVSRRDIEVVAGHTSPLKTIRIDRIEVDQLRAALRFD